MVYLKLYEAFNNEEQLKYQNGVRLQVGDIFKFDYPNTSKFDLMRLQPENTAMVGLYHFEGYTFYKDYVKPVQARSQNLKFFILDEDNIPTNEDIRHFFKLYLKDLYKSVGCELDIKLQDLVDNSIKRRDEIKHQLSVNMKTQQFDL